jgi:hypothetical protein
VAFEKGKTPKGAKPFKKGQSGNPAGRPEGARNRSTVLKELLSQNCDFTNPLTLKKETADFETQIMTALIVRARRGDVTAIREILDTVYGKQSNVNFNLTPDELERLSDEELDSLITKFNR